MKLKKTNFLMNAVREQKHGRAAGIYSICSAHRWVLEAAMMQAERDGTPVLVESTSNQVDQFGGYTGMTPAQFVAFVRRIAADRRFPVKRIVFGGDHLGPNAWQREPAAEAMAKARDLVRAYARAGYTKIHLDASMRCADDPAESRGALADEVVAARAADLCAAAEAACKDTPGGCPPVYVIGTEVPPPGGAREKLEGVPVTDVAHARHTLSVTRAAFFRHNLQSAWERVVALVVQPGVEFDDAAVAAYDRKAARPLARFIEKQAGIVFEAHSTDYQTRQALRAMVEDHFAVLKVGPWLTFALREALFALEEMEVELLGRHGAIKLSDLRATLERTMLAHPEHWNRHYHGDDDARRYARQYSYSDRCRYYWPNPDLQKAVQRLIANLQAHPVPLTLLSQYLPGQYRAVRELRLAAAPQDLIRDKIMEVTSAYSFACGQGKPLT